MEEARNFILTRFLAKDHSFSPSTYHTFYHSNSKGSRNYLSYPKLLWVLSLNPNLASYFGPYSFLCSSFSRQKWCQSCVRNRVNPPSISLLLNLQQLPLPMVISWGLIVCDGLKLKWCMNHSIFTKLCCLIFMQCRGWNKNSHVLALQM